MNVRFRRVGFFAAFALVAAACANILNFEPFRSEDGGGSDATVPDSTVDDGNDAGPDVMAEGSTDAAPQDADAGVPCEATLCDGACLNTTNDRFNCGGCGLVCTVANTICQAGACVCGPGFHECTGTCFADDDITHCGASCTACIFPTFAVSSVCADGGCSATCSSSYTLCNANTPSAACVALTGSTGDPMNCGTCGNVCTVPENGVSTCAGTPLKCGIACNSPPYNTACADASPPACVNTTNDVRNCGGCGHVCSGDAAACVLSECE